MELYEGAILIVGGIWLVGHMSRKTQQTAATLQESAGVSNASNLTNTTNQAGGLPAVAGESLVPPNPPLISTTKPVFSYGRMPFNNPRISQAPVIMSGPVAFRAAGSKPPLPPNYPVIAPPVKTPDS